MKRTLSDNSNSSTRRTSAFRSLVRTTPTGRGARDSNAESVSATHISLPASNDAPTPNVRRPIDFVLLLTGLPNEEQAALVQQVQDQCVACELSLAIIRAGNQPEMGETIAAALRNKVNEHTGVMIVHSGAQPDALELAEVHTLQQMLGDLTLELASNTAQVPGTLTYPTTLGAGSNGSSALLADCVGGCWENRAQRRAASEQQYLRRVDTWARGQVDGTFVKFQMELHLQAAADIDNPPPDGVPLVQRAAPARRRAPPLEEMDLDVDDSGESEEPIDLMAEGTRLGISAKMCVQQGGVFIGQANITCLPPLPWPPVALHLEQVEITELPANLPDTLVQLHLDHCPNILCLPATLPNSLQTIYCVGACFARFPAHLPVALTTLSCPDCDLTEYPTDWPVGLTTIDFGMNQLISFPEGLEALTSLRKLVVSDNQITGLPTSIISLPAQCEIDISNCPLPESVRVNLQRVLNAPEYQGPTIHFSMPNDQDDDDGPPISLNQAIELWTVTDDASSSSTTTASLHDAWLPLADKPGTTEFVRFLQRLAKAPSMTRGPSRQEVVAWLAQLPLDPTLCEQSFAVALDASSSCDDRVSLIHAKLMTLARVRAVELGQLNDDLPAVIRLARQVFRLQQLEAIATAKAKTLHFVDEIEVHLAYPHKLHAALQLPGEAPAMLFFKVADVTQGDLSHAERDVKRSENAEFAAFLATWSPWKAVLRGLAPTQLAAVEEQLADPDTWVLIAQEVGRELNAIEGLSAADRQAATAPTMKQHGKQLEARLMQELTAFVLLQAGSAELLTPRW